MKEFEKTKFALVGYGRIGSRHAEHICRNERAALVAVCDIQKERAEAAAARYGCVAVQNLDALLDIDADIVDICTPSGLHADMSVRALRAGRNVLCEKPMCLNLIDADRVIAAERESGKRFLLVKQNRYNPPIAALKECIKQEKLGAITLINCNILWNRGPQYYTADEWRGTMALDGGALMTQCSHFLDLMIWIGGPIRSVFARMQNLAHPYIETEDTGFVTVHFENGAIGSLQYTMNVYEKNFEGSMTVLGTKGTIRVGGEYLNTLDKWNVEGTEMPVIEKGAEANDYGTYKGSMSNHDKVVENVCEVLQDGAQISANSLQGRESVEAMQAAYLSAIEHEEVYLPLRGPRYQFKLNEEPPMSNHRKKVA